MAIKLNLEKHIFITSSNDVREICKPLFNSCEINYFDYFREYQDGSRIWLSTNENWTKYLYQKDYCSVSEFELNAMPQIKGEYFLWQGLIELLPTVKSRNYFGEKLADAKNYFNIDNGIAYIEDHGNYRDFYSFGTKPENHGIINYYLNNLDIFEKFSLYFQEKASHLIKKSAKEKIYLPKPHTHGTKNQVFPRKKIKKPVFDTSLKIALSERQSECVHHLLKGNTANEIADILHISCRTVEHYIEDIKEKFKVKTRAELIRKLLRD